MKILNIREGRATNSSSSHSIILSGSYSSNPPEHSDYYGWDFFTLDEPQAKLRYMAIQFRSAVQAYMRGELGPDNVGYWLMKGDSEELHAQVIAARQSVVRKGVLAVFPEFADDEGIDSTSVDHQSLLKVPYTRDGHLNAEFWREFSVSLANDGTAAIRGGNDNEWEDGGAGEDHSDWAILYDFLGNGEVTDFEESVTAFRNGDVWTLFRPSDGTKIHLTFQEAAVKNGLESSYQAELPQLIDLKINDNCSIGCKFCYQNSTPEGAYASPSRISQWLRTFSGEPILEFAIGGGEPTEHPHFLEILQECSQVVESVAFTTKSTAWMDSPDFVSEVVKHSRGLGYSVSSAKEMKAVREKMKGNFPHGFSVTWHVVPDTMAYKVFQDILNGVRWGETVLLLGYKSVGRAEEKKKLVAGEYLKRFIAESSRSVKISVDTSFVQHHQDVLDELKVSSKLYYAQEGRFSMYYDAVEEKHGPSSYEPSKMRPSLLPGTKTIRPVRDMFQSVQAWKV